MSICNICGIKSELYQTLIEGTELNVCMKCSKFGKVIKKVKTEEEKKDIKKQESILPEKEIMQLIVSDYAGLIKNAREKLNLKQEDFAKKINEKQNLIHLIETSRLEPSIDLAKKLEKALKIKLIEEYEETGTENVKKDSGETFTIGDFIKVK